ncbi:hypothetical protein ATH84_102091 [Paracoccus versutus]|uniref:Uncharacterized protein n=1 Tax=Paracoccus versutus TaxID=34007 RepID=A0AAQ0HGD0_PARVE|nr:hypothetical protein ATH84_102091 [Paracoccus versutus]
MVNVEAGNPCLAEARGKMRDAHRSRFSDMAGGRHQVGMDAAEQWFCQRLDIALSHRGFGFVRREKIGWR